MRVVCLKLRYEKKLSFVSKILCWLTYYIKYRSIHYFFQFSAWIDALLLVFSLENEESFSIVCGFYNRMCSFRNMSEVPKILVGVQGERRLHKFPFSFFFSVIPSQKCVLSAAVVDISLILLRLSVYLVDSINDSNPRVIKDVKPQKLACDLRCPYYETCAIYGLNVERVFQDGERIRVRANTRLSHVTDCIALLETRAQFTATYCTAKALL